MFLKSVDIFGFKSFADRSRIEFRDGISALLGPNGCGKSNVVDAVKWVLGEQSSRTLRAEKMEDVIFNGTEARKALNVAEVTLTIHNEEGLLPLDMPEIQIKRRLYRSGESEYYLNSTPVRLRELREVFFDTGVGKSAYSIMEQGKIDQVLSNKPEERRYLFEEAAGITRFKLKGAEAERKLKKTEENVQQVENILSEVRKNHDNLKVQAEKTITYRRLREEIFELEVDIQLLRLKDFLEKKNSKEQILEKRRSERDSVRELIDSINDFLEENMDLVNNMESQLIEHQKQLYGIDLEKNSKDTQINILKDRISEFERIISEKEARTRSFQDKIENIQTQIEDKESILNEYGERLAEIEENIGTFENNIETSNLRIEENEDEITRKTARARELEAQERILQNELTQLTDDIVDELDRGLKESGYSHQGRKEVEQKILATLKGMKVLLDGKSGLLADALAVGKGGKVDASAVESSVEAFKQLDGDLMTLVKLFAEFQQNLPHFLDDFLAPEGIITQKRDIEEQMEAARGEMEECRDRAAELRDENKLLSERIAEYRVTLEELRVNHMRMKTQQAAIGEMVKGLNKELSEQQLLYEENLRELELSRSRMAEVAEKILVLTDERQVLEEQEKALQDQLSALESDIKHKNKDLVDKEKSLKDNMEKLARSQEQVEKIQMDLAEINTEVRNIYENFREKHSRDLSEFDNRMYEIQESLPDLRGSLSEKKAEQKGLGQVNLMAPEEYAEVKERYDFLNNQLEDLNTAREDLKEITTQIRTESTELFLKTYDQIKKNFHSMFRRLFGGGRAELRLSDPDSVLESGIEIFAQPPGKKLENIALLSGGERSMTAVGLLFATYMVRPSPFCILDEIDAALDEANVGRFVNLLMEFGEKSQFIVITHNKKTAAGAKSLLGVTMEESGVSKVIAIRLEGEDDEDEYTDSDQPDPESGEEDSGNIEGAESSGEDAEGSESENAEGASVEADGEPAEV